MSREESPDLQAENDKVWRAEEVVKHILRKPREQVDSDAYRAESASPCRRVGPHLLDTVSAAASASHAHHSSHTATTTATTATAVATAITATVATVKIGKSTH